MAIFDFDYLNDQEEERERNRLENASLINRVVAGRNAAEAPKVTSGSITAAVPDPGLNDDVEDILFRTPEIAPPPPEREKTWRDTTFGKIVMGDRQIQPSGGTAKSQYDDFLKQDRPRAGIAQVGLAALAGAAANSGRVPGQRLDTSAADDILFGNYERQGGRLREAAQQEMGQDRINAIQTSADARVSEVERRANDELAKLAQRQREVEAKQETEREKQTESTLRTLASRGFDPTPIDNPADAAKLDPNEWIPREMPDGSLVAIRRNARVQEEKAAPRMDLQDLMGFQMAQRLADTLAAREQMNAADNATTLQRGREADTAALERVLKAVEARGGGSGMSPGQRAFLAMLGIDPETILPSAPGAPGQAPQPGQQTPTVLPDPRLQKLRPGQPVRMANGEIQVYVGPGPDGKGEFRKPKPGEFQ